MRDSLLLLLLVDFILLYRAKDFDFFFFVSGLFFGVLRIEIHQQTSLIESVKILLLKLFQMDLSFFRQLILLHNLPELFHINIPILHLDVRP